MVCDLQKKQALPMPSLAPAGIGMLWRIQQGQDFSPGHCNSCTLQKVRRADSVAGGSTHTKGQRAVETHTQLLLRGLQTSGCSLASALFYLSLQWVLRELVVLVFYFNKEQPGGCIRGRGTCSLQLTHLQIKATAAHRWISVSLSPPICTCKHTSTHTQALKQSISQCICMYTYIYTHIYLLLFLLQVFLLRVYKQDPSVCNIYTSFNISLAFIPSTSAILFYLFSSEERKNIVREKYFKQVLKRTNN